MSVAPTSRWAAKASLLYTRYARGIARTTTSSRDQPCRLFAKAAQVGLSSAAHRRLDLGCGRRYFWAPTSSLAGRHRRLRRGSPRRASVHRNDHRATVRGRRRYVRERFSPPVRPWYDRVLASTSLSTRRFATCALADDAGRFAFTTVHPDSPSIPKTRRRRVGRSIAELAAGAIAEPVRARLLAGGLYADEQHVTRLLRGSFDIEALKRFESEAHLHCWCVGRKRAA